MKHVFSNLAFALGILVTSALVSSCASGSLEANAPGSEENPRLYRPVNGTWAGHWTPDRAHAEDHLRTHNAHNSVSGGVVEYK